MRIEPKSSAFLEAGTTHGWRNNSDDLQSRKLASFFHNHEFLHRHPFRVNWLDVYGAHRNLIILSIYPVSTVQGLEKLNDFTSFEADRFPQAGKTGKGVIFRASRRKPRTIL